MRNRFSLLDRLFLATGLVVGAVGCDSLVPPRPPIGVPSDKPDVASQEPKEVVVVEAPGERFGGNWEDWHVFQIGGQTVGRATTRASTVIDPDLIRTGDPEVRIERDERLIYQTGSVQFTQRRQTSSIESYDGGLKSFEIEAQTGPVSMRYQGAVTDETLRVGIVRGSERENRQLAWDSTTRGLFAVEQSLRRRPMEIGETRRLRTAVPALDAIGLSEMRCTGEASVPLLDGEFRVLTEIELDIADAENQIIDQMLLWTDEKGVVHKTLRPALRLESYRVSASQARKQFSEESNDVRVWVAGKLDPEQTPTQVAMLVKGLSSTAPDGEMSGGESFFQAAVRQSIRPGQSGRQVLYSVEPAPVGFSIFESSVRPSDTSATALLDFNQPDVARLSKAVGDVPPEELVTELTRVGNNILSLGPQQGARRASMVIRSERGGEFDHTVLLTALLRSRGVPARVVLGLRPDRSEPSQDAVAMRLSSWVLASVDNQWRVIDPMRQSDLDFRVAIRVCEGDEDLRSTVEAVFRQIANVVIEIRGVRYESDGD
ncbi:MAG: transglutaminase domain-containing protein [Planctomycetota bacterium]